MVVEKAMERLKAITQNEAERFRYLDRLKAQLDHDTMMRLGDRQLEKGLEMGRKEVLAKTIRSYQQLLKLPTLTPTQELLSLDVIELQKQLNLLERELGIDPDQNS